MFSMTILRVKFPTCWPGWNIREFTLTSVVAPEHPKGESPSITVNVDPNTTCDYYSDSPVFRASLIDPSNPKSKCISVALKFAMREDFISDLAEELNVYNGALEPLQGSTIPRCYGLYAGSGEEGQTIACLVLEYWGECLRRPFNQQPLHKRVRILERLGEIHRRGLLHGDFAERNVLELNGDIRIIDFDQTTYHKCNCKMNFRPSGKVPSVEEFGCEQLWEIGRYMKLWTPNPAN
ncbi:hypothetical protein BDQ12DRAFT_684482 [Crucibulum laeve]|uniref:Protein kinase domain-containing protein n=1 Tax=Crucibulum laeve TaxID=68775 RepID=A0A5C3LY00_9AGAR|nr:hypothetical protein BDQ12DRAFT_684482 [Crucibulum laeve]